MALTTDPPINLTDIQDEFDANSLVSASNAAGLSLPTGMLEFLGLSSSVTLIVAPSFFLGTATVGDVDGWQNTNSIVGKTAFTTGTFANSPTVNPQVKVQSIEAGFTTSSVGWAPIPSNAIINNFSFTINTGAKGIFSAQAVRSNFWIRDSDPFGAGNDGITNLGQSGPALFFSNFTNQFTNTTTGSGNILISNINFRERTPKQTQQQMFIDSWNNGLLRFSIAGRTTTGSFPSLIDLSEFGDPLIKRNDDPNIDLRIYRIICILTYSLP